jgi:hypothetical protein
MFKSKVPEKDQNAAANAAEVVGRTVQQQQSVVEQPCRGGSRRRMRRHALASAPVCRSSATSNAMVQPRSSAESKASCAPLIFSSAMAHRSRAASLRRTSQSAAASRAPSVPSASSCKTVGRLRATFFIGRCRSTRTLCLKDRLGGLRIQRIHRRASTLRTRRKRHAELGRGPVFAAR